MELNEIFSAKNIAIYIVVINLLGILIMYIDKQKAKKGAWRIQEKTIFLITALGGGIGTIIGMHKFRHKTQKIEFLIGLPFITILEIILFVYYILK